MSEKKNYINGVWISEKTFDDGGAILKLSVLPDKLIASLKTLKVNNKGYARLVIAKSREPKENSSHYIYEDTFNPQPTQTAKAQPVAAKPAKVKKLVEEQEEELI